MWLIFEKWGGDFRSKWVRGLIDEKWAKSQILDLKSVIVRKLRLPKAKTHLDLNKLHRYL